MSSTPGPFKVNPLNIFCAMTLMVIWGDLFGVMGFLLGFVMSMAFFPPIEERK